MNGTVAAITLTLATSVLCSASMYKNIDSPASAASSSPWGPRVVRSFGRWPRSHTYTSAAVPPTRPRQLAICQASASMLREMAPVLPNPSPDPIIAAAPSRLDRPVDLDPGPALDWPACGSGTPWSAVNSGPADRSGPGDG